MMNVKMVIKRLQKHSASSSFKISTQKVYSQFEIDHLFKLKL